MIAQTAIRQMTNRIAKRFKPDKIVLFGSHARGTAGPDSDVDLLVIMPVSGSKRKTQVAIRCAGYPCSLWRPLRKRNSTGKSLAL